MTVLIFLCNSGPHRLVAYFIGTYRKLVSQSQAKIQNSLFDIETINKMLAGQHLGELHPTSLSTAARMRFDGHDVFNNKNCASTQFLHLQKNVELISRSSFLID